MKIYHGSKIILEKPTYKGSNPSNDYGAAFYATLDYEDACIWASRNNTVGFVNQYEINTANLKILDLTDKEKYSVLHWITLLLENRTLNHSFKTLNQARINKLIEKYHIDINEYDIVIGYRADDAYFRFPKEFVVGNISLELLEKVFELGELGKQFVIVSKKAIDRLHYKKAVEVEQKYIGRYYEQVQRATIKFDKILKESISSNEGTRIGDLLK